MSERYPTNAVAFNTMEPKVTSAQSNASQKGAIYSNPSEQFPATEETSIPGSSEAEAPMVPSTTVTAVEATLAEVTQSPSYATTTQVSTANIDAATTGDTQIHAATTHAPKIDHQQMAPSCQPTAGIQSIVSNPMPITTETSITPATFLINNPVSTPLCISNSFAATTSSNACLSTSEEAAAAKVAVGQMAAIVVALLGVFGIFVACILVKKRKRTKKKKKKEQYHPFFYMNEPTDQQETSLSSETFVHRSNEALCQFYENERPAPNQTSDLSENVCDGNVFYNNSTSYHRSNSVVSHHEIHKALTVITSPAESHQRHTTSLLGKANMDPIMTVETTTSLHPHNKQTGGSELNKQRLSTDADAVADSYTLSAMRLFHSCASRNTVMAAQSMSPASPFASSSVRQQYWPSLHDSIFWASQGNCSADVFSMYNSISTNESRSTILAPSSTRKLAGFAFSVS